MSKGKFQQKRQDSKILMVLVAIASLVILALACILLVRIFGNPVSEQHPTSSTTASENMEVQPTINAGEVEDEVPTESTSRITLDEQFPALIENGELKIESLAQYTGANPDCNWEEGHNTGVIVLNNISNKYVKEITIQFSMSDGSNLTFYAMDIPAGATVWVFESTNSSLSMTSSVLDVSTTAEYAETDMLMTDKVSSTVNGVEIGLTNISGETLSGLTITCHSVMNGVFFGGVSYTYTTVDIGPGGTAVIAATDCFLGETALASITSN